MTIHHTKLNLHSLSSMPNEVKYLIIDNFKNDFDSLMRLACVCRAFHALVITYEQQFFPMSSWLRDSKKWSVFSHQKESTVICDAVNYKTKEGFNILRIGNKYNGRGSYREYLSSFPLYFDTGVEYRINDNGYVSQVYISKFSEELDQKLWCITSAFFVNIHPFEGGFILVSAYRYTMYKWDKNGTLIEVRNEKNEKTDKIHSSIYLDDTLFLVITSASAPHSYFHYYIKPHDPKSILTLVNPKLSNYKKKRYYKEQHTLLKLGNNVYSNCNKHGKLVLTSLQSKINNKNSTNSIKLFNTTFFNTQRDDTLFLDIYNEHIITNENWTICYSATKLYVLRKNKLWMETKEYSQPFHPTNSTFITSDFLFICSQDNFRVIFLPAKKEVTDLFSPLSQYLTQNNPNKLHACSIQFSKNQITISAFIKKLTKVKVAELFLFQFSINPCNMTFNDVKEDSDAQSIFSDEQFIEKSEKSDSDESIPTIFLTKNKKSSSIPSNIPNVSQPSHSDCNEVKANKSEMDESEDTIKENSNIPTVAKLEEEGDDTEDMLGSDDEDFEEDSTYLIENEKFKKTDVLPIPSVVDTQKTPSPEVRKIKQITPKVSPDLTFNPYKVILVVSFIFFFGGLSSTAILVALHPGFLLFKVSVINVTIPTTITLSVTSISAIVTVAAYIMNKRKQQTSKQIESRGLYDSFRN